MTPYAFRIYLEAMTEKFNSERTRDIAQALNGAWLNRAKHLPRSVESLMNKKPVQRIDGNAIFRRLDKYQKHRDKGKAKGTVKQ